MLNIQAIEGALEQGWIIAHYRYCAVRALDISLDHQRRPYDGVFLALAERLDEDLITADRKLANGLHGTPLARWVRLLEQ